jgi:hypothetical protein
VLRVKSYTEAVQLANMAGIDASKKRMRNAGRTVMSWEDRNHGADVTFRILKDLGYDVASWLAQAGLPRNEPEPPKPVRKPRRRKGDQPVQLAFAF